MAAPATTEQTKNEVQDRFVNFVYKTIQDGEFYPTDLGKLQDYFLDYIGNEVGSDLKSLTKVGDLLENLKEENNLLGGQVN